MGLSKTTRLFFIILIEGYVVLATELLAIRQLIPFVGSGTETVAIIISAVLLPLAVGYHTGGKRQFGIRKRLLRNTLTALIVLSLGLSYVFLEFFFMVLTAVGVTHQILQTAIYSLLFLSPSVFMLGQTVPLVSNYFGRARINEITGRMLFFSTVGSFLGSVFSTLVLMNTIGVHFTVIATCTLLFCLIPMLSRRWFTYEIFVGLCLLGLTVFLNSPAMLAKLHIVSDNRYNTVVVHENPETGDRVMDINRTMASGLDKDNKRSFSYIRYIETIFIDPIAKPDMKPHKILILGAGGFTVGLDDTVNHYTFVDIDPALKQVAEQHFIKKPLSPNKQFVAASARAFVHGDTEQYDLILIDTFTHILSPAIETTTEEFLRDVKARLAPNGTLVVNQLATPDFRDRFSVRYNRVFGHVFDVFTRQVIDDYNPWSTANTRNELRNVLYIYNDRPYNDDRTSYTDDKNLYTFDRY